MLPSSRDDKPLKGDKNNEEFIYSSRRQEASILLEYGSRISKLIFAS